MTETIDCEVFGDESSSCNRYGIYSLIGLHPNDVNLAVKILDESKKEFNIPITAKLHCRILFSNEARAKTDWNKFDGNKATEFCKHLSSKLLVLNVFWSYGYIDFKDLAQLPHPKRIQGKFSTELGKYFSFNFDMKQAQKFAYSAAEMPFIRKFNSNKLRFWCDKETTKIDWFFGKKQAQNIHMGIGSPAKIILPDTYIPMLEIADLFAYTASRHLSTKQQFGQHTFRVIHEKFHPISTKFHLDPSLFGSDTPTREWLATNK